MTKRVDFSLKWRYAWMVPIEIKHGSWKFGGTEGIIMRSSQVANILKSAEMLIN